MRSKDTFGDGFQHKFKPLEQVDLSKINCFSDLVEQMSKTAFGGRALGKAADVMCTMIADPNCLVVATVSGAMTIAKQSKVIADLIANGCIDAIVTTGAIICHGLAEELGNVHFEHEQAWTDKQLYEAGYNRVYDTLEPEKSMDEVEKLLCATLSKNADETILSSSKLCRLLGEELSKKQAQQGFIQEAFQQNVPVFIPAFTDSELGLDLSIYNKQAEVERQVKFDPMLDLDTYTNMVSQAKYLGILTIGGGVPRNWAQQVGPYVDAMHRRGIWKGQQPIQFQYGVRICPEPAHWGGLSGCTYKEGVSWGKFVSDKDEDRFAEVLCDATIVLPLLTLAVFERLGLRSANAAEGDSKSKKNKALK